MANSGILSYLSDADRIAKTIIDGDIRIQARAVTQLRQLTRPVKKFGAHKGQAVEIEKFKKLPKATSPISELLTIPAQRPTINYVTATIYEYGNSVVYTGKAKTIAQYALDEVAKDILARNVAESMDGVASAEFRTNADVFWTPTGTVSSQTGTFDNDGTISTAATRNIQLWDIRKIIAQMKSDNIPKWDGRYYLGVFGAYAMDAVFSDVQTGGTVDVYKYSRPEVLINGEIGAYYNLRIIEETNSLSSTLGTQSYNGEFLVLGYDPVAEALVEPEGFMTDSWDYGRFTGNAWRALTGFKKVWVASTDTEYHLVRVWST